MGFISGLLNLTKVVEKDLNAKKTKEYEKCKNLTPEKLLIEMDKVSGDLPKLTVVNSLYREKTKRMSDYELKKITEGAREHCSAATFDFACKIYQERTKERDPWH